MDTLNLAEYLLQVSHRLGGYCTFGAIMAVIVYGITFFTKSPKEYCEYDEYDEYDVDLCMSSRRKYRIRRSCVVVFLVCITLAILLP